MKVGLEYGNTRYKSLKIENAKYALFLAHNLLVNMQAENFRSVEGKTPFKLFEKVLLTGYVQQRLLHEFIRVHPDVPVDGFTLTSAPNVSFAFARNARGDIRYVVALPEHDLPGGLPLVFGSDAATGFLPVFMVVSDNCFIPVACPESVWVSDNGLFMKCYVEDDLRTVVDVNHDDESWAFPVFFPDETRAIFMFRALLVDQPGAELSSLCRSREGTVSGFGKRLSRRLSAIAEQQEQLLRRLLLRS